MFAKSQNQTTRTELILHSEMKLISASSVARNETHVNGL